MTVDECMAKATEHYDQIVSDALVNATEMLHAHGCPTSIELAEFMQWYEQLLANDRASTLERLRAWLERDGSTLQ